MDLLRGLLKPHMFSLMLGVNVLLVIGLTVGVSSGLMLARYGRTNVQVRVLYRGMLLSRYRRMLYGLRGLGWGVHLLRRGLLHEILLLLLLLTQFFHPHQVLVLFSSCRASKGADCLTDFEHNTLRYPQLLHHFLRYLHRVVLFEMKIELNILGLTINRESDNEL